jgi:hypothetical protein
VILSPENSNHPIERLFLFLKDFRLSQRTTDSTDNATRKCDLDRKERRKSCS